jgi:hypothetical protein
MANVATIYVFIETVEIQYCVPMICGFHNCRLRFRNPTSSSPAQLAMTGVSDFLGREIVRKFSVVSLGGFNML